MPVADNIECGVLTVDDGAVTIPYAVLKSSSRTAFPDPIIYFSGGPR